LFIANHLCKETIEESLRIPCKRDEAILQVFEIAALSRHGGIARNDRTELSHSLFAGMTFQKASLRLRIIKKIKF